MTSLPPLPAANAELRRIFAAGAPPDGNLVPLVRALLDAQLVVPTHQQGGLLRLARRHAFREGREELCLNVFTSHELFMGWVSGVRDLALGGMVVIGSVALCKRAISTGVDVIDFDRGAWGYSMRFHGMVDVLSRSAFDGRETITVEHTTVAYRIPEAMPQHLLDEVRAMGHAHRLTQLLWCMREVGDAPLEMQLVYAPFPNAAFVDALIERMNDLTRDRFTVGAQDAHHHDVPVEHLRRLI